MTDLIQNALMARLRSVDWYYDYSDDYTVWSRERVKLQSLRLDLAAMPVQENQEMLGELLKSPESTRDLKAIEFLQFIIAKQILQHE